MPLTVMLVILVAALMHASWNYLVKRTHDKHLGMGAMVLGHLPFAMIAVYCAPPLQPGSIPFVIAGALLHTGYQFFLLNAYRVGDLSQVYPLARGIAPLIITGVSVAFLNVDLTRLQILAVGTVGTGIMSLTMVRRQDGMRNGLAAIMALATGAFIAGYSLVDGLGARQAGTAVGFYGWVSLINALIFATITRVTRPGLIRQTIIRRWPLTLACGGISYTAYTLVVWAFTQAPIALVTALRETSIIFALLIGVFVLKERLGWLKLFATLVTVIGVGLLRLSQQ